MELFLKNNINVEDFSFCFIAKYDNINQILREMKQDFETKFDELSNLLIENKNTKLECLLCRCMTIVMILIQILIHQSLMKKI